MKVPDLKIFWSNGDEAYIAVVIERPNLSAFGDSPEEALKEMREVLKMVAEAPDEADQDERSE